MHKNHGSRHHHHHARVRTLPIGLTDRWNSCHLATQICKMYSNPKKNMSLRCLDI
jgi:hypothetical protein